MASSSSLFERLKTLWARRQARAAVSAQVERGDAIIDPSPEIRLLLELPSDFIPDDARELARDLFGLLLFLEMTPAPAGQNATAQDSYALLGRVRASAWQGYWGAEALGRQVSTRYPGSDVAQRFALYCDELAKKRSTYLFLPVVAGIDRHQAKAEKSDDELYEMLEEATARQDDGAYAALARMSFALAPEAKERAAFTFASMLAGSRSAEGDYREHLKAVAGLLRRIALAAPGDLIEGVSKDNASMINELSDHAPWIWLEVLVVVENWIAGPQWFDNAFEVEISRISF